jgi:hypothetical protein
MTIEDRLRRAIDDRTSSVHVDEQAGLERVNRRLLTPEEDMGLAPSPRQPRRPRQLLAVAAALVLVAVVASVLLLRDGETQDQVDITDRPGRTEQPSTTRPTPTRPTPTRPPTTDTTDTTDTTADETPTPAPPSPPPETSSPTQTSDPFERQVVWPRPSSEVRFDDPVAAARSFALFYARFDDPVIGEFRAADSHSGEVPVRPQANGPETLVRVAVSQNDQWFVTGSGTADITVNEPTPNGALSCPVAASGTALAFEGTVQVRIDAYQPDGDRVEMGRGFVTGSGAPPAGRFSDLIACTVPSGVEESGIVAFWTDDASGELDGPVQFVAIPVRLP